MSNATPGKTHSPLTLQQAFDNALHGIRRQGYKRSTKQRPGLTIVCAYRGTAGLKCAIGHSLPDHLYDEEFDKNNGFSVQGINSRVFRTTGAYLFDPGDTYKLGDGAGGDNYAPLANLQGIHDGMLSPNPVLGITEEDVAEKFEIEMSNFAKKYGLTYEPPKGD